MDGQTYLAIFKENGLVRSELVRTIESQVKTFDQCGMLDKAEEAKWVAIEAAEEEKKKDIRSCRAMKRKNKSHNDT